MEEASLIDGRQGYASCAALQGNVAMPLAWRQVLGTR